MRTIILFFITCIIATFGYFAALNMQNPWPGYAVAFGVWAIFIWTTTKPKRKWFLLNKYQVYDIPRFKTIILYKIMC